MQPDSRWFEKNVVFGLTPSLFGLLKLGFPSFSSHRGWGWEVRAEGALGLPPVLPSSCKTSSVFVICCVIFFFPFPDLRTGVQGNS